MAISVDAHVKVLTNVGDPLILQDGTALDGIKITFTLVTFGTSKATSVIDAITGELIAQKSTIVITDAKGEFTTSLWPNNRGDSATAYKVTFSKLFKEFYILVDASLDTSLLSAKAAYAIGTGAVLVNALATMLTGYARLQDVTLSVAPVSISYTGVFRTIPLFAVVPASGLQLATENVITPQGKWIDNFTYMESTILQGKELLSLTFNDLIGINTFLIANCYLLTAINFTTLKYIINNLIPTSNTLTSLTTVSTPQLKRIGITLNFTAMPVLAALAFTELDYVGQNIIINNNAVMTSATFPKLTVTGGAITISGNTLLNTLTFPLLNSTLGITITSNPELTSVNLSALQYSEGSVSITTNAKVTTIDLSNAIILNSTLVSTGAAILSNFIISSTLKKLTGNITFTSCVLTIACVNNILSVIALLDGTNGTTLYGAGRAITLTGAVGAPTGAGLTAKATLEARGVIVTTL